MLRGLIDAAVLCRQRGQSQKQQRVRRGVQSEIEKAVDQHCKASGQRAGHGDGLGVGLGVGVGLIDMRGAVPVSRLVAVPTVTTTGTSPVLTVLGNVIFI
jgi:hypothetical protein